jgi:hypothetical protein
MNVNQHAVIPALEQQTKPAVDTATAAYYFNRRPQTLREWACYENGPIRPLRINGRLAWPVSELRRLLVTPCQDAPGVGRSTKGGSIRHE